MAHATLVKMDITFVHSYHNVLQIQKFDMWLHIYILRHVFVGLDGTML